MSVIKTINARFSAAALRYDGSAAVQKSAAEKLFALIPAASPRRMLDIGCGTGQLTQLLRHRWPASEMVALDAAEGMVAVGRRRMTEDPSTALGAGGGLKWIVADVTAFRDAEQFDLVASNCALHWLHPLDSGLRHVASLLSRGGMLACSLMLRGTLRELHEARRVAAPAKRPLAEMPSRELVETLLAQCGLTVTHAETIEQTTSHASAAALLRDLHAQGLTGGALSRAHAPLTRGEIDKLIRYYDERYRQPDGSIRATYNVGFFVSEKL